MNISIEIGTGSKFLKVNQYFIDETGKDFREIAERRVADLYNKALEQVEKREEIRRQIKGLQNEFKKVLSDGI